MSAGVFKRGVHYYKRRGRALFVWSRVEQWLREDSSSCDGRSDPDSPPLQETNSDSSNEPFYPVHRAPSLKDGKLFFDSFRGACVARATRALPTPLRTGACAGAKVKAVDAAIAHGSFDCRAHFPRGSRLHIFYPNDRVRDGATTTFDEYITRWHEESVADSRGRPNRSRCGHSSLDLDPRRYR